MPIVTSRAAFLSQWRADNDSPDDPNLVSVDELMAYAVPSNIASAATSTVTSQVASGGLGSVPISTADSKAVSSGTRASVADSKAISQSVNTSVADSKALSVSGSTSIADSKATSVGTALFIPTIGAIPGFLQTGAGATVRTANSKMADTISVKDFGAVGNGVTDDTVAVLAAFVAGAGTAVCIPRGATYLVSQSIPMTSGTHYYGGGCFKLKAGTDLGFGTDGLGVGLLHGINCVGTFVEDIEVDGNGDATTTKCHAITFNGGEWNTVKHCHVHDTYHAGIEGIAQASFQVINNDVRDCGRGGTNDHGIMFVSTTAAGMTDTVCKLNRVDGTNRKGIASYAQLPGFFRGMDVSLNTVTNSGLGDIYLGAVAGTHLDNLTCTGNTCSGSPVNLILDHVRVSTVGMNTLTDTTNDCNIHLDGCSDILVVSNTCSEAYFHAILLAVGLGSETCVRIKIQNNNITKPNQGAFATGSGIAMESATYCDVSGNSISDDTTQIVYGVLEDAGCDYNTIENNPLITGFTNARVHITGANTRYSASTGLNRGVGTATPTKPFDMQVDLNIAAREYQPSQFVTLSTGDNNNVVIPAGTVLAPTSGGGPPIAGNYAITGIAGGEEGRRIVLFNFSSYTMTIKHSSASSTVGNRIFVGGSTDLAISPFGSVTLVFFATANGVACWAVESYKA